MNVVTINNGHTVIKAERIMFIHLEIEHLSGEVNLHIIMEDGHSSAITYSSQEQALQDFAVIQMAMQECSENKYD